MELNFLTHKDGVWSYATNDQQVLLADAMALLNWDLHRFDCWLFDSDKWSMYTRRRQYLIELRTGLASAWRNNANDFSARELLILDFCLEVWERTRSESLRGLPEVQAMEGACRKAKTLRRALQLKSRILNCGQFKLQGSSARLMPHVLRLGASSPYSV